MSKTKIISESLMNHVHKDKLQRAKNMAFIYNKLYGQPTKRRNQNDPRN